MLSVFPLSQDNMLGFTLDGEVDDTGLRRFLTAIEAKVLTHQKIRLLGNIKSIGGWDSFQTFWKTLKAKRELIDNIEKYAVLTDNGIMSSAIGSLDWVAPGMVIKTFKLSEGEVAHQWLGEPLPAKEAKALKRIDVGHENILALSVVDKMQVEDYESFNNYVKEHLEKVDKVRILLEIVDLKGISFRAFWEDLKAAVKHYNDLERIALIGDQGWLKGSVKIGDILTPGLDMAAFGSEERDRAINWLL